MRSQHTIEKSGSVQSVGSMISNCTDFEKSTGLISQTFSTATPSLVSDQDSFSNSSAVLRLSFGDLNKSSFHLRKRKASEIFEQEMVKSNVRRVMSRSKSAFSLARAHVVPDDSIESSYNVKKKIVSTIASTHDDSISDSSPLEVANKLFQEAEKKSGSAVFDKSLSSVTLSSGTPSSSCLFFEQKDTPVVPALRNFLSCNVSPLTTENVSVLDSGIKNSRNSYGWFVEMDNDGDDDQFIDPYAQSKSDLAFKAPTAPKRSDYEVDVAYAHAADTVDDVLGDFF
mmetsp:Transcript_29196/g.66990  ORF Transcript_29196/g.66990 Transcript_29196/m.66990 type:complete len:284 (-) Transcript_29196:695-1546(-)|eukprot:CAMPEP_0113308360 /NCGR_PEP_ID=MMETSP0010_2-20120614/6826_1 /TAXON_ID=216773 ORGANISM="Corethron hystrix, Strain 308" /NCGR_SAMPLE_ID=MMETSP0010_2 /ASSEMBLY_ACC=CAM_ASM_000155 /LENGTH=283 /DNA_ID=CAMNT_0000163379 /DNA_START=526 /DNA_END=1377 /DNA_ORIENTATION=- /assembly_acc=CAM_ASM_000155